MDNMKLIIDVQVKITQAIEQLDKIRPVKVEQQEALSMAKEELDVYQKLTLFELQRAFEG